MKNRLIAAISWAAGLCLIPTEACKNTQGTSQQKIQEVTDSNFQKEVLQSDIPVFVDFYAAWCRACKKAQPALEDLSMEYSGSLKMVSYDIDSGDIDWQYGVQNYPTYIIFINGREARRKIGFDNKAGLEYFINSKLND